MEEEKKLLAIIPARSGSKGLKNKNIRLLKGKPLIAYTIEAAKKSNVFADIFVSTDSKEYKEISEQYGAWVPFLRKENLSGDEVSTIDVIIDVLQQLKKNGNQYDSVMLLQPTSPLRDENDIYEAVKLFYSKDINCLVSMCECEHSPLLAKEIDNDRCLDGFLSNQKKVRRQDLKPYYRVNGAIYLFKVDYFLEFKDFYKEKSYAFIMDKQKSIDIDDFVDFEYAEFLLSRDRKYK